MQEISAALDDADEGDDEERHDLHHGVQYSAVQSTVQYSKVQYSTDLHHGPDLPDPAGQVDVALGQGPVEHLGHEPRLEGDHRHDQQGDGQHLAAGDTV